MLIVSPDPRAGDGGPTMTLNHMLTGKGIILDVTVRDVMDARGEYLLLPF